MCKRRYATARARITRREKMNNYPTADDKGMLIIGILALVSVFVILIYIRKIIEDIEKGE